MVPAPRPLATPGSHVAPRHAKAPRLLSLGANRCVAEDMGFEPMRGFIPNTISNRAH